MFAEVRKVKKMSCKREVAESDKSYEHAAFRAIFDCLGTSYVQGW